MVMDSILRLKLYLQYLWPILIVMMNEKKVDDKQKVEEDEKKEELNHLLLSYYTPLSTHSLGPDICDGHTRSMVLNRHLLFLHLCFTPAFPSVLNC